MRSQTWCWVGGWQNIFGKALSAALSQAEERASDPKECLYTTALLSDRMK
ncbi:hypothetical protein GF351_02125 [Candidatus Woesearchaeota archaeon]|nr:hypothetical protein [Candidatus Woesearchaeota archaeon]